MSSITIFVPVYNGELYLEKTIDNITQQSFRDFEVLFVDDSSTDSSVSIIRKAAKEDERIKLFVKKHEGSVAYSWNFLLSGKHLNSPWTLYMSQDDLLHPKLLENLIRTQNSTGADAVIPSCRLFSDEIDNNTFTELNKANDMSKLAAKGCISGHDAFELMFDYTIPGFALWNTNIIKRIGMPTEAFNSDEGMQRIWILNCKKVAFESSPFYYRQRNNSIGKGVGPHHFYSVLTEMKLLSVAKQEKIDINKINQAQYNSLFWTLWLSCYKNIKNFFSIEKEKEISNILKNAYKFFIEDLPKPKDKKQFILFLTAKNSIILYIYIFIYTKYLKSKYS
ncbi:MAG: glycosyltransferase family 2 protein [Bacteroidales bacterium]|nr:glycosyltransferase family 2 protein [Bacteroidales bacterium]